MRNLSLERRHLVNAYEVEAGIGVIAGNTVWFMPERLECEVLQKVRYINTLTFTFIFSLWTQFITFLDVKSSFSMAFFFHLGWLRHVSTNNKIRNENPALTGSLAGSKQVFLHSICLSRRRTNESAASILACRDWCSRFATGFSTKKSKATKVSPTCTNLSNTWSQTWSKTMFAAG